METDVPDLLLQELCADLRLLWGEAGGPTLRVLSGALRLGKTQVGAILTGQIRRPPHWRVVHGMVAGFVRHAHVHGRVGYLSRPTGLEEFWRPRHALLEHVFSDARHNRTGPAGEHRKRGGGVDAEAHGPRPTPRQLPAAARQYTARTKELSMLTKLLDQTGEAVVIAAIDGAAGIGKTALAVQWAHQVADRFPDGQLYADLRGFTVEAASVPAGSAVRGFLDALGVPPESIPSTLDGQAALYRSLLAGKRILVVLDNAYDAAQVRPALPGTPGCLAVVTSRTQLTGLVAAEGANPITLSPLAHADARELLACHLGPERLAAEPAATDELIAWCAGLPLALTVMAARAATKPEHRLADLAGQLRAPETRLDALDGGDPHTDVRTALASSYRRLSAPAARLFRLLGQNPDTAVDLVAATQLGGLPAGRTRQILTELIRANVVGEPSPGQYTVHDLMRTYAAELPRE
ncbi:MAG TPA: NB-ARC domain-containing protein [Candidatus Limnocylindrales bacterium]